MCTIEKIENITLRGRRRSVTADTVSSLLMAAAKSSAEAPSRALKRRVRQRLHKKLGCMLGQKDFEKAMNQFKMMEESWLHG
eukprot:g26219.t1